MMMMVKMVMVVMIMMMRMTSMMRMICIGIGVGVGVGGDIQCASVVRACPLQHQSPTLTHHKRPSPPPPHSINTHHIGRTPLEKRSCDP